MNLFVEAARWLGDPSTWTGADGLGIRLGQHLLVTAVAVIGAALIGLPVGLAIGHLRRGEGIVGAITGAGRSIPTIGLLTLIAAVVGIGVTAPMIALVVLAVPSILAGAYSGVQSVDPDLPQAARAVGMSPRQVLWNVEIPLGSPVIIGGLRAATLQVVATATLAAYTADVGLGRYLFAGLKTRDYAQMLGASLIVIALALTLEIGLAVCQRLATRLADPAASPVTASSPGPTP